MKKIDSTHSAQVEDRKIANKIINEKLKNEKESQPIKQEIDKTLQKDFSNKPTLNADIN